MKLTERKINTIRFKSSLRTRQIVSSTYGADGGDVPEGDEVPVDGSVSGYEAGDPVPDNVFQGDGDRNFAGMNLSCGDKCRGFFEAFSNIYMTTIGAGIFALGTTAKLIGFINIVICTVLAAGLSFFTHYITIKAIESSNILGDEDYENLPYRVLKGLFTSKNDDPFKCGTFSVSISFLIILWLFLFTSSIAYCTMIKVYISHWLGWEYSSLLDDEKEHNIAYWGFFMVVGIMIISLLDLRFSSDKKGQKGKSFYNDYIKISMKILATICITTASIGYIILFSTKLKLDEGIFEENLYNQEPPEGFSNSPLYFKTASTFGFFSILCMCFLNHINLSDYFLKYKSTYLKGENEKNNFNLVWISQLFFTLIYLLASILPILVIEGEIEGNTLLEIEGNYGFIFQLASCLGVLLSLTLIYMPSLFTTTLEILAMIKGLYYEIKGSPSSFEEDNQPLNLENVPRREGPEGFKLKPFNLLILFLLCLSCYLISVSFRDGFQLFMGLAGCITASSIMFIFPGIIYGKHNTKKLKKKKKRCTYSVCSGIVFSNIVILIGLIVAVSGILWTKVSIDLMSIPSTINSTSNDTPNS